MKSNRIKKLFSISIVSVLILSLFLTGCGNVNSNNSVINDSTEVANGTEVVETKEEVKGSLEDLMPFITENYGLTTKEGNELSLSDYELQQLKDAFELSMTKTEDTELTEEESLLYGGYDPLTITVTHILNQKAGIAWTSYSHTGVPVPTFAKGVGAQNFDGYYDNTDIFTKLNKSMGLNGESTEEKAKYVFLFIGDGVAMPQISAAENYLGSNPDVKPEAKRLSYTTFPSQGMNTTYSANSFITDSAAAGTAIATGVKTDSGMISQTPDGETHKTVAEMAKESGKKIGIVTTTTINHATPAVFYAHNESRNNYYDIGLDLVESGFDYFAGGVVNKADDGDKDVYELAEEAGMKITDTVEDFEALSAEDGRILATSPSLSGGALPYSIDTDQVKISLADFTKKGIEVLDNENGFLMMVEGGKVDWACHANDAASSINDTIGFDDAVKEALAFYEEHPDETLIVVTGDHETGGMTLGFAGTGYESFYNVLDAQKASYEILQGKIQEYKETL